MVEYIVARSKNWANKWVRIDPENLISDPSWPASVVLVLNIKYVIIISKKCYKASKVMIYD